MSTLETLLPLRHPISKSLLRLLGITVALTFALHNGCKDQGAAPPGCDTCGVTPCTEQWEFLGFQDKFALRFVLAEPYLYVCAGSEGLWRRNIRQASTTWQHLGLADTSLGPYFNRGVQDIVVHPSNPQWLLAAFTPDQGTDHGIYHSFNGGSTWSAADSGLEVYFGSQRYYNYVYKLIRSETGILGIGDGVWTTTTFGELWQQVAPVEVGGYMHALERHPSQTLVIWAGGEGVIFQPILSRSTDGGSTWVSVRLDPRVPRDNAVYTIAFDPIDPNIVYFGLQGAMIKTTDGGQTWIVPLITHPQGAFFRAVLSDPRNRNRFWAAAGRSLMRTTNAGGTWETIESPNSRQILHMLWDATNKRIHIATEAGVYSYRPCFAADN